MLVSILNPHKKARPLHNRSKCHTLPIDPYRTNRFPWQVVPMCQSSGTISFQNIVMTFLLKQYLKYSPARIIRRAFDTFDLISSSSWVNAIAMDEEKCFLRRFRLRTPSSPTCLWAKSDAFIEIMRFWIIKIWVL